MAEIKTFGELEKALGELMLERGTGPFHEEINYYNVLGLINSFEARWRARLRELEESNERIEKGVGYEKDNEPYFETDSIEELRSILEGEGGEKEKLVSKNKPKCFGHIDSAYTIGCWRCKVRFACAKQSKENQGGEKKG